MLTIEVEGVTEDKRDTAEKEIKRFFGPSVESDPEIDLAVLIPKDFDAKVTEVLQSERGVSLPYSARREEVIAVGKTIPLLRDGELSFVVIFNATALGRWEEELLGWRHLLYSHELSHVLDEILISRSMGIEKFLSEPETKREIFLRLAQNVYMEYRAERWSLETFQEILRDRGTEIDATQTGHESYVDSFASLLQGLPDFVNDKITGFQYWRMTIDELWPLMYERLRGILVLAAFTSAHSDALDIAYPSMRALRTDGRFHFFFEVWEQVERLLRDLASIDQDYDEDRIWEIGELVSEFFNRCGVEVTDVPGGTYFSVHRPRLS